MPKTPSPYPELVKLQTAAEKIRAYSEFIEWLGFEKDILLRQVCPSTADDAYPEYGSLDTPIQDLLAEYFGVDLKKAEQERRQMLASLREDNSPSETGEQ